MSDALLRLATAVERLADALIQARTVGPVDELTARRSSVGLESAPATLNRREAASVLGVDPRTFDKTLRRRLTNCGTPTHPRFSTKEILQCLDAPHAPGNSASSPEARISSSGSSIRAAITRNPRAQATLQLLKRSPRNSTTKS